jgi:hypothetical protein
MLDPDLNEDQINTLKAKLTGKDEAVLNEDERQYLSQLIDLRVKLARSYSSYSRSDDSKIAVEAKAAITFSGIRPPPPK